MSPGSEYGRNPYQIENMLYEICFRDKSYYEGQRLWESTFGMPSIFYKIESRVMQARELMCPHCGKRGKLSWKTTISKKKYRYTKMYVYHETKPIPSKTSIRNQKWCYVSKAHMKQCRVKRKLQDWLHEENVKWYFYQSLNIGLDRILQARKLTSM